MKLFLFVLFLFWLYHYWHFTGKRKYIKKLVVVAEHLYDRQPCEQNALELASAYMQAQRYADAYSTFQDVLKKMPGTINKTDIVMNMEFCKKPLPWSSSLKNHNMGYLHNFMLVYLGGRRKVMISQETIFKTDDYLRTGHI